MLNFNPKPNPISKVDSSILTLQELSNLIEKYIEYKLYIKSSPDLSNTIEVVNNQLDLVTCITRFNMKAHNNFTLKNIIYAIYQSPYINSSSVNYDFIKHINDSLFGVSIENSRESINIIVKLDNTVISLDIYINSYNDVSLHINNKFKKHLLRPIEIIETLLGINSTQNFIIHGTY